MKKTIGTFVNEIAQKLSRYEDPTQQQQIAWWILEAITSKSEAELLAQGEIELDSEEEAHLKRWVYKLVDEAMPVQYLLGSVPFNDVEILVEPPVLIPRPETEEWTVNLIKQFEKLSDKKLKILELATGSGCIGIALAKALPQATIVATDISDKALELAQKNAEHNRVKNISFIKSDVYDTIPKDEKFDLIVVNPPYIRSKDWETLDRSVTEWEDRNALVAEHDGLAIIEQIIAKAPDYLQDNEVLRMAGIPQLVIEIDYRQATRAKELMEQAMFERIKTWQDLAKKDRVITGRMPHVAP